jgi:hypothetical protein
MEDLVWVQWYATIFRSSSFAEAVAEVAPIALRYGATQYQVHVSNDDMYKVTQMTWMPSHAAWYTYWEGPEMIEFRARNAGRFQVPIVYSWADEIASGSLELQVENGSTDAETAPVASPGPG